jgi:hypothetical protein
MAEFVTLLHRNRHILPCTMVGNCHGSELMSAGAYRRKPLDLNADAPGVVENIQLFHTHTGRAALRVLEANICDPLGQGFGQVDVPVGRDRAHLFHDVLVTNDILKAIMVIVGPFPDAEIQIDSNALNAAFFMLMDADVAAEDEVADKHMTKSGGGIGDF